MPFHGDVLVHETVLQLPIDVEEISDHLILLAIHGDVDLSEAGELRAVLGDACTGDHDTVIVDLRDVHFISSSGMQVLAEAHRRVTSQGRVLEVQNESPAIREAFEFAHIEDVLTG